MNYRKIEEFLFSETMEKYLKEGFSISLPMPELYEGHIVESFFISNSVLNTDEEIPFAKVIADCESNELLEYKLLSINEINKIKEQKIGIYQSDNINKDEELTNYKILYYQVKNIAYKDAIYESELKVLKGYFSALLNVVGPKDMKFYICMNERFFTWLNSVRVL